MKYHFFTYGPFLEGQVHYSKFSKMVIRQKQAFVKASAYRMHCGYPILDVSQPEELMVGSLVELSAPETFWSVLDGLLGVEHTEPEKAFLNRSCVPVVIDSFTSVNAQIYCINPKKITKSHKKISRYQWSSKNSEKPEILIKLKDQHRWYISKLSVARGRKIVPLEMDIYRELLSMGVIVDRGRRLALTPLGREIDSFRL